MPVAEPHAGMQAAGMRVGCAAWIFGMHSGYALTRSYANLA